MDNLPPLRALQVFDTLGRCSSIAEAAKRLGISAGAVSQQMKLLEDSLGVTLLVKEGKREGTMGFDVVRRHYCFRVICQITDQA